MSIIPYTEDLPCFKCKVTTTSVNGYEFHTEGHYPSDILNGNGHMVLRICPRDLLFALDHDIARSRYVRVALEQEMTLALPCIRCRRRLWNVVPHNATDGLWARNQPYSGLSVNMADTVASVCDPCIAERFDQGGLAVFYR